MSAVELSGSSHTAAPERPLCGWGRSAHSRCRLIAPRDGEHVAELLTDPRIRAGGVLARGAGRSYGDAAQIEGGTVLDTTGLDEILHVDRERGLVSAQAGATLARVLARLAAEGLKLPVLPGTRHVTVAGAIASDIHGKNHHRDGALARHVASISLCTPDGRLCEVTPEDDAELFYATLGGMGLTGVIVAATLRAEPLVSPWVRADEDRTEGLEQTLALLAGEERHRYSVAWMDLLTGGARMGRAVVSRADPMPASEAPSADRRGARYPEALLRPAAVQVPARFPGMLLRPASVRAFNELRWRAARRQVRGKPVALAPYFFPLDVVGAWNRLYGTGGLIQYQYVIPAGREDELVRSFELIRRHRLPVYLAVFKRFGPAFGGPLSFPLEGWTLAADLPAGAEGVERGLRELDELVAGCGGRVYLSKDGRMAADLLPAMYPQLPRFQAVRERVDPEGVLRSDLARRLSLGEGGR